MVELLQVTHHRGHSFDKQRAHVLGQVSRKTISVEQFKTHAVMGVHFGESLDVYIQKVCNLCLVFLAQLFSSDDLDALRIDNLEVGVEVNRVELQESFVASECPLRISVFLEKSSLNITEVNLVQNELAVLFDKLEATLVVLHCFVGAHCHQVDFTLLVGFQLLPRFVAVELLDASDAIKYCLIRFVDEAGFSVDEPVVKNVWLLHKHQAACFLKALKVAKVNLELTEISHDTVIAGLVLQGVQVSSSRLIEILDVFAEDSVNVPAREVGQVLEEDFLDLLQGFLLSVEPVEQECAHRKGFRVVGVLQDEVVVQLHSLLVFLVVVTPKHILKLVSLLLAEALHGVSELSAHCLSG